MHKKTFGGRSPHEPHPLEELNTFFFQMGYGRGRTPMGRKESVNKWIWKGRPKVVMGSEA